MPLQPVDANCLAVRADTFQKEPIAMSELNHLRTAKLAAVVDRFLLDRQVANQSSRTIETYTHRLKRFTDWSPSAV